MAAERAGENRLPVARFWREIALSAVGLAAAGIGFAVGAVWGWAVLGAFLIAMGAWVLWVGHAMFLFPGLRLGYIAGQGAVVAAIVSAAIGLGLVANAKDLARWTHRSCAHLKLPFCQGDPECANEDVVSVPSPARSVRAVRFVRTCDAKSATHVSIVAMGEALPDEPGNAFIVDGKLDLVLLWIDGKHLAVAGGGEGRMQRAQVNGVRISYGERPK